MKKYCYAKALALTVAASMVSVPAFAAEGTDDPQAQEKTVEQDEQKGEKSAIYETKEPQANAFHLSVFQSKSSDHPEFFRLVSSTGKIFANS